MAAEKTIAAVRAPNARATYVPPAVNTVNQAGQAAALPSPVRAVVATNSRQSR